MIKRIFVLIVFTFLSFQCISQTADDIKMPTILPASPEASAINKGAALSVGMFTGAANASIPLGEIKMNGLSVPVSLNYSGNGLKVDEISSRTGHGWTLSTSGVVSRIVHDLPDDKATRLVLPSDFPNTNQATLDALRLKYNQGTQYDSEPDEFRVDAPGLSIKFVLDNSGLPVIINHSNEKIAYTGSMGYLGSEFTTFTITNTSGIVYKFGGGSATETTQSHANVGAGITTISRIRTAFYLTQIKAPNGDYINFNYNPITTLNVLGVTHKFSKGYYNPGESSGATCYSGCSMNHTYNESLNTVTYETVYLSGISASNGQSLSLLYDQRLGGSTEKLLKSVTFGGINVVKKFDLIYENPSTSNTQGYASGPINDRYFLKEVKTNVLKDNFGDETLIDVDVLKYQMEYIDLGGLPQRLSYSQDHLGFYNGQNNQNLLPSGYLSQSSSYANANRNYNGVFSEKGMLKKIIMPTGGYEEFEYEPNKKSINLSPPHSTPAQIIWSNVEIGGVRVKKVNAYDPVSSSLTSKFYKYNSLNQIAENFAVTMVSPTYRTSTNLRSVCASAYNAITDCYFENLASSSTPLLYTYNGSHVGYPFVIESDDLTFKHGGIQHNTAVHDFVSGQAIFGDIDQYIPTNTTTTLTGVNLGNKVFNANKQILKEDINSYHIDNVVNKVENAFTIKAKYNMGYLYDMPTPWTSLFDMFNISKYTHQSNWIQLDSKQTIEYDLVNNTSSSNIETYSYGTPNNVQPIATESTNSKNQLVKAIMKYPTDFPTIAPYNKMVSHNILTPVVETETFNGVVSTGKVRNEFFDWHPGAVYDPIIIAPKKIWAKRGSAAEESRIQYFGYDIKGHPLEVAKEGGAKVSYIWGYNNNFPIAEIKNASVLNNEVAYTSFETSEKGHWNFSGSSANSWAAIPPTGGFYYDLNSGSITKTINFTKNYILTYWLKDGSGSVFVNSSNNKILISRNGWTCYEHKISNNTITNLSVSGTGSIDELRLYPEGSFMTTMTHRPFVGISSRNEANNQIVYYEYDGSGRLIRIRDMDRNIVKQMDYQYKKQIMPCNSITPNWVMSNNYKCAQDPITNNYTGQRLVEEVDQNNCSNTYLSKRWTFYDVSPSCQPIAGCSGLNQRLIMQGGVLVCETGTKVYISSVKNPGRGATGYTCTYHYVWSDGYVSIDYSETSPTACFLGAQVI